MATSFADGTKISFEMAIVANATVCEWRSAGCSGRTATACTTPSGCSRRSPFWSTGSSTTWWAPNPLRACSCSDTSSTHSSAPTSISTSWGFYTFYRPYHLCHFEVPSTLARATLFGDATVAPLEGPVVDVVATAKRDLRAGEVLDGVGWYMTYGLAENADVAAREELLPMGLAERARLVRDVAQDAVLTDADVKLPQGRLCDRLRAEQSALFAPSAAPRS
jgi:predicted homoserine dehydrogenase-like protein